MKKHTYFWLVMFLAISLALPICSMAQTPTITLESYSTGDRISGAPIKSFFWGTDGNLVVYLDGPFTFSSLLPDIAVDDTQGTYTNCVPTKPATVTATQPAPGTSRPISFKVISATSGATLSLVVDPEGRTLPASSSSPFTFPSWDIGGSTPAAVGAYLAVFEGTSGTNKSQLVVMIKVNPEETVTVPTSVTGSSTGIIGTSYPFVASGSTSIPSGDTIQYQFDWKGDGSDLSQWGSGNQSKTWTAVGTYTVKARAGSATYSGVQSGWSTGPTITISPVPTVPTCTYACSAWGACQSNGTQTCTTISAGSPSGCTGTAPSTLTQSCNYVPPLSPAPVQGTVLTWNVNHVVLQFQPNETKTLIARVDRNAHGFQLFFQTMGVAIKDGSFTMPLKPDGNPYSTSVGRTVFTGLSASNEGSININISAPGLILDPYIYPGDFILTLTADSQGGWGYLSTSISY